MNTDTERFLCRAKHVETGKWVEGAYYKHLPYTPGCGVIAPEKDYKHLIIRDGFSDWSMPRGLDCYEIDPETLGQCTGLRDKNGKLIYEGDVIKIVGGNFIPTGVKLEVCYGWISWQLRELVHGGYLDFYCGGSTFEVIGNIHQDQFREVTKKDDEKVRQCEEWLKQEVEG